MPQSLSLLNSLLIPLKNEIEILKSERSLLQGVLAYAGSNNLPHGIRPLPAISQSGQYIPLEAREPYLPELREHSPVEYLLGGELAGLRVDEGELDDGGQDVSQSGQEGEASQVALQVVER